MNLRNFALTPFTPLRPGLEVAVTGSLVRDARTLAITYTLRGPLAGLVIPAPDPRPARRDGLWEATCFEFFLAAPGTPAYWEFNLSPAGHWNVYRFADYRTGMTEETAVKALEVRVRRGCGRRAAGPGMGGGDHHGSRAAPGRGRRCGGGT